MSFPRYPEYKDSGVEWLGEVPAHWSIASFKRLVEFQNGADHKTVEVGDGYPVYGSGGVFAQASDYLYDGESVLLGRKGTIDKPLHVNGKFWTVDTMYWTRIKEGASGRFCYYAATSFPFAYYSTNTALPSMTQSALGAHLVAYPAKEEQTAIAAFLDRETAKIDALVAEQETLIALLKEKRQAVISHAVTKGLNPDAPMKPSDIEWLGDVPAHWDVAKGSRIGSLFGSEQVPEESVRDFGQLPFIKVSSLSANDFCIESWDWFVDEDIAVSSRPHSRFVVFPKRGAAIFMNKVNVVTVPALLDPNLMGWEIREGADPLFFAYVLKIRRLESLADISTVPQINNKHIAPELFPVPPKNEQHEIVASLDKRLFEVDALTQEANRAITLLKERRSALISAAVTGQIDVRGLAG